MTHKKIEYDIWANNLVCGAIKKIEDPDVKKEALRLFAHLFKAQVIWFNRINGITERVDVWGEYTEETCASLLNDSHAMLDGIAKKIGSKIDYTDTKGNKHLNSVSDIFEHVIIHGQHHRAQIMYIIRQAGGTPPPTDYIYFLRSL